MIVVLIREGTKINVLPKECVLSRPNDQQLQLPPLFIETYCALLVSRDQDSDSPIGHSHGTPPPFNPLSFGFFVKKRGGGAF